jgi:hypothetical protein
MYPTSTRPSSSIFTNLAQHRWQAQTLLCSYSRLPSSNTTVEPPQKQDFDDLKQATAFIHSHSGKLRYFVSYMAY